MPPPRHLEPFTFEVHSALAEATVARIRKEHPTYVANLWLALFKPQVALEVPIDARSWRAHDGAGLRIDHVNTDTARITMVSTRPSFVADTLPRGDPWAWLRFVTFTHPALIAVNRSRSEYGQLTGDRLRKVVVNSVEIDWMTFSTAGGQVIRGDKWVPIPGWLDGASLLAVQYEPLSMFERTVTVPAVTLEDEEVLPPAPSASRMAK